MSYRIKKDDRVVVLSGKDKGQVGKVLKVLPATGMAIVQNVKFITEHKKTRDPKKPGGRLTREAPVHLCKLMLICEKCNQRTRVGVKVLPEGGKIRVCRKCNAEI